MARILIVEDERELSRIIEAYMGRDGHETTVCSTVECALEHLRKDEPDLIILDLMLPDGDGEDVCRFIRGRSSLPVLMVTAKADEVSQLYGFRLGADDYISKPFSPRLLSARVGALLRRASGSPAADILYLDEGRIRMDSKNRQVTKDGIKVKLTPQEFDILLKLVSHPGRIFSREEIIQSVMGYDFGGSPRTIDSHIRNLRSKLEDRQGVPRLILTSRGRGFFYSE